MITPECGARPTDLPEPEVIEGGLGEHVKVVLAGMFGGIRDGLAAAIHEGPSVP